MSDKKVRKETAISLPLEHDYSINEITFGAAVAVMPLCPFYLLNFFLYLCAFAIKKLNRLKGALQSKLMTTQLIF